MHMLLESHELQQQLARSTVTEANGLLFKAT